VRWRQPGEDGVGLNRRVRDEARPAAHGLASQGVMLVPGGEGRDHDA